MKPLHEKVVYLDALLEARLKKSFGLGDDSDQMLNLVRSGLAARQHPLLDPDADKEAYLAFISKAWDDGIHQLKVNRGEIEGTRMNRYSIASNFCAYILTAPEGKKLLPKK